MTESSLFVSLSHEEAPKAGPAGPFASVAIERSLDRVLDYAVPRAMAASLKVGQRVKVPLGRGNKPTLGYVVSIHTNAQTTARIKPVLAIDDDRVLVPEKLMQLAQWMAKYYCCPLGTVFESIIPSAVKKKVGLEYTPMVRLAQPPEKLQELLEKTKAAKRRSILARLLQLKEGDAADLAKLAGEAGVTPATVRKLVSMGLISITAEPDYIATAMEAAPASEAYTAVEHALNDDQRAAYEAVRPRLASGFSVNLLHGVTGSGKTEVYLRCIKDVVEAGKQAIVLVPEIALTPQTVRRFTARFPKVAILHSGLAAGSRHRFWQQIASGQADVVVGARSAIFAPMPDLGIIVVDEEHEPSYKQDTAPRYHGRDVAIKRGQLEGVPVILGSATPSLESWVRCGGDGQEARRHEGTEPRSVAANGQLPTVNSSFHLLSLPRRVRGLQLPFIELIDMKQEYRVRREGVHLLSQRLEHLLKTTIEAGHQAILLLNRRGYANFVHCPSCTHLMQCKYCDVTLTYHRSAGAHAKGATSAEGLHTGQLHCHYCLAVNPLPEKCPDCGKKLSLFGLGTQRVEEELLKKIPGLRYARVDSDSMHSAKDYENLLSQFARNEIQVMLGTQMIAKGLDYPNVTLVGVVSGDTALSLPDFRASERTFQLITQVAGRAGRGDHPGRVVLQTFQPDSPVIQAAIKQDFTRFAETELKSRREVGLPPFSRMVRIILRDEDLAKVQELSEKLAIDITNAISAQSLEPTVALKGPMPCAINRISGYHRFQILLISPSALSLQRILAAVRHSGGFATSDRIAVDVDPTSLL